MPQVQLDDELFKAAQRRAANGGFFTVDANIADIAVHVAVEYDASETPNLDRLCTPERLATIDRSQKLTQGIISLANRSNTSNKSGRNGHAKTVNAECR